MKFYFLIFLSVITVLGINAQEEQKEFTENTLRINFLSQEVEYEVTTTSTLFGGLGVAYGGSYPDLSGGGSSFQVSYYTFFRYSI